MNTEDYNELSAEEARVILNKGTERPFTGSLLAHDENGLYVCKQCHSALYRSEDKFNSHCGWPSFDDEIPGAVKRVLDADGRRTEIVCAICKGHLGHVFEGEYLTDKNTRHCVNSVSMSFVPKEKVSVAIFASGCFWGTEYYFKRAKGVLETSVGYIGGEKENPTYREVCSGGTGHAEATLVHYDPDVISYEALARLFFETHDPTQKDGQGPDIGHQYRSAVFYNTEAEKEIIEKLIAELEAKSYGIATEVVPATKFWMAEDYHQDYYDMKGGTPYCHAYTKRF